MNAKRKPGAESAATTRRKGRKPAGKNAPRLRLEWIEAGSLTENPNNWRRHSEEQLATVREVLEDPTVGWAGACLFNEGTGRLIDGHARKAVVDPATPIPVLVGNWSAAAEAKILATLDPVGTMAAGDQDAYRDLVAMVENSGRETEALLEETLASLDPLGAEESTRLEKLGTQRPPERTWVLVRIDTVRFYEIQDQIERIAAVEGVMVRTQVANGERKENRQSARRGKAGAEA